MSSTPDPRDWSDEQIDALLERLEEHVDTDTELGQAVKSRRRDVLKAIGAVGAGGLAGAAGMEAATGEASAGTEQAGTLGEAGNPLDFIAEDIYGPGGQGSGDAVGFEAVQTGEFNTIKIPESGDSIQTLINDIDQGPGQGAVLLRPDVTYQEDGINIRDGVAVIGLGATAVRRPGVTPHVEPTADNFVFDVPGGGQLRNVGIDVNSVTGYSSRVVRLLDGEYGDSGSPQVDSVFINADNTTDNGAEGVALRSESGNGVSDATVQNTTVFGTEFGFRLSEAASADFVNGNHLRGVTPRNCRIGIDIDSVDSGRGNDISAALQANSDFDYLVQIDGTNNSIKLTSFDIGLATNGWLNLKSGSADNSIIERNRNATRLDSGDITDKGSGNSVEFVGISPEALVERTSGSDTSFSFLNLLSGTIVRDTNGLVNSGAFSPLVDSYWTVGVTVEIDGPNTGTGDIVNIRVRETSTGSNLGNREKELSRSGGECEMQGQFRFLASETYEIQATDENADFELGAETQVRLNRVSVDP